MLAMCEWRSCQAAQRTLLDVTDHVEAEDVEQSGNCVGGCVRQVVDAVAPALGQIDCELRVENFLDHTDQDVAGGSLNVVHSCTDADGNLLYQVRRVREREIREITAAAAIVEPTTAGLKNVFEAFVLDRIKPILYGTNVPTGTFFLHQNLSVPQTAEIRDNFLVEDLDIFGDDACKVHRHLSRHRVVRTVYILERERAEQTTVDSLPMTTCI